jgi:hypothetical protein
MREHRHRYGERGAGICRFAFEIDRVLRRQPRCLRQPWDHTEWRPAGFPCDRIEPIVEQSSIAAEFVDDETTDAFAFARLQNRVRAHQAGDDAAAIDVACEDHRNVGGLGESHVGDVSVPQVDLCRTAGTFDQYDIAVPCQVFEAVEHGREEVGASTCVIACAKSACALALDDYLCAGVGLRLQKHRVHVNARLQARCARLHRLCAADFAALDRNGGVV